MQLMEGYRISDYPAGGMVWSWIWKFSFTFLVLTRNTKSREVMNFQAYFNLEDFVESMNE